MAKLLKVSVLRLPVVTIYWPRNNILHANCTPEQAIMRQFSKLVHKNILSL